LNRCNSPENNPSIKENIEFTSQLLKYSNIRTWARRHDESSSLVPRASQKMRHRSDRCSDWAPVARTCWRQLGVRARTISLFTLCHKEIEGIMPRIGFQVILLLIVALMGVGVQSTLGPWKFDCWKFVYFIIIF
jgi:hypothetical protein